MLFCPRMCGNVRIPYPFGIGDKKCAWSPGFALSCNRSFSPPRPYYSNMEVMNISLERGEMLVYSPVVYACFNSSNTTESEPLYLQLNMTGTPFLVAPERNELTATGCDTMALLGGRDDGSLLTGCITTCASLKEAAHDDEPCTGQGCCQMSSIPHNLSIITMSWDKGRTTTSNVAWTYSPCNYAFVSQRGWYKFSRQDLRRRAASKSFEFTNHTGVPTVLDWAIRTTNGICLSSGARGALAPACVSTNSYCVNATNGDGYLCNCSKGYTGNPYHNSGCTNINECEDGNPCYSGSKCEDTEGSYKCKCQFWYIGDGKTDGGCWPIVPPTALMAVAMVVASAILAYLLLLYIRRELKRRLRKKLFDRNGGNMLRNMLKIRIYTEEELQKITTNYNEKLGDGAFGEVYKGIIDKKQEVAVKRIIPREEAHSTNVIQEITSQAFIQHTNLVRLVGCCLETDAPRLVLEFVPNGTLHDALHGAAHIHIPLLVRMDIAIGSAEALAYMHSNIDHNSIVHGDIKSSNILLGRNMEPKVSDFGSSKLMSVAMYNKWTVFGDLNYIDPVYFSTGDFTDKSDVYSFGVVLLELITRKKVKYDGTKLLVQFDKHYKDDYARRSMYDQDLLCTEAMQNHCMECLDNMAAIAVQCVTKNIDERPTMAEVLQDLKQLRENAKACSTNSIGDERPIMEASVIMSKDKDN